MLVTEQNGETTAATDAVLRALALKAIGLSGADIERLVREARQKARRARRSLVWSDVEALLSASRPVKPKSLRWRMALHEAGHAVARLVLDLGAVTLITIDGPKGGGYVEGEEPPVDSETEERLGSVLVVKLAGRAAEQEILGSVTAGAGGSPASDLAGATALAMRMEVAFGFGREMPLLYRNVEEQGTLLVYRPEIAQRVNARLEEAYSCARDLIRAHRSAVEDLARNLVAHDTLEGQELTEVLERMRGLIKGTA